jgi:hypothetical protein
MKKFKVWIELEELDEDGDHYETTERECSDELDEEEADLLFNRLSEGLYPRMHSECIG